MLLLTLRGTPTIYYGEELGMRDVAITPDAVQDPWERNVPGLGLGRDPCRTPMCWTAAPGAGFTTGTAWLPLGEEFAHVNVAQEREDPGSFLSLYRALLALRGAEPALSVGSYRERWADQQLLMYDRTAGSGRLLVALNFSGQPYALPPLDGPIRILLSTQAGTRPAQSAMLLRAHEGIVAEYRSTAA
jgi:alpha-glucosidase